MNETASMQHCGAASEPVSGLSEKSYENAFNQFCVLTPDKITAFRK
jgi:hypothetical protein